MRTGIAVFLCLVWVSYSSSFGFPDGKRISERKCDEYRKLTVKTSTLITLSIRPTAIKYDDYKCPNTVDLIVGGERARLGEFPHQALLGYPSETNQIEFKCGGSLISKRFVLTAAHCSKGVDNPTVVRLAELDLAVEDDDQVDFDVEQIIKHPKYTQKQAYNDIALVKLAQDVLFTKMLRPACLWAGREINTTQALATGFGHTEYGGKSSDQLMKVQLDVFDASACNYLNSGSVRRKFPQGVIDSQICAGSLRDNRDTCQGDSGGPLEVVTDQKGCTFHIVGITSTGAACGFSTPSIYTRVSSFIDWIEATVWGEEA
ncbi:serine protease snake-like [Armigeres subalbatus]|uniref:serine protease snake-like n=1 Tax=Armigeres subalbatus TaxID=124917 RepID=UPI002ED46473